MIPGTTDIYGEVFDGAYGEVYVGDVQLPPPPSFRFFAIRWEERFFEVF